MEELPFSRTPKFKNPEEEISFLRGQLAVKERVFEGGPTSFNKEDAIKETIDKYSSKKQEEVLDKEYTINKERVGEIALDLTPEEHDETMEELLGMMQENGIKNTLEVVKKMNDPHITDDFHRFLVQYVQHVGDIKELNKESILFRSLNMKLYEISLPSESMDETQKTFKETVSAMEQFYAGMIAIADGKKAILGRNYFTLEIALSNVSREVVFYASVPSSRGDLFEKQITAVFPNAKIQEQKNDYNIFNEDGASVGAIADSARSPVLPIKTYDSFDVDPMNVLLNVFSKLKEEGEGASVQILIAPAGDYFIKRYGKALDAVRRGANVKKATDLPETFTGELTKTVREMFTGTGAPKKDKDSMQTGNVDDIAVEQITQKISSTILSTNIRVIASAETESRAHEILDDIQSAFHQFDNTQGNSIIFEEKKGRQLLKLFQEFSYRIFPDDVIPLNLKELTTIVHFPVKGTESPHLREAKSGSGPAPLNILKDGTLLGVNSYRGTNTDIYIGKEDRLRHFYVIGQTGTGKTNILKNMILQDIEAGSGVCMIDPHGTDIQDILARIPDHRLDDVIYFDPSHTERPMGLNILEYDPNAPEQKTFIVDELLSIFNKLFDMKVSGGPMFEQYFRNATLLVIENPESGNTLLDIGRIFTDQRFRELKLSRCNNPVVKTFWTEIATKATGDQSLSNFAPYITNKFDVFTANEIMRPIIAQEKSAFNIRDVMDNKKILLINISKGRLGEINSNLIGLIIVGKILMAALSRVDSVGKEKLPDFYLYIDEFQNVTTPSIASILSEARKYGLSLNIANQFIAQLEDNIKDAVFGNVGSMAIFRTGTEDAEFLQKQLEPTFSANDIVNLDNYNAYLRLLVEGVPVKPFNIKTLPPEDGDLEKAEKLKQLSYMKYGRDRSEIEAEIQKRYTK